MKRLISVLALAGIVLAGSTAVASAEVVNQKRGFGTFTKGSTVCVGPLSPTTSAGVQIFGFTNASGTLTWQVFRTSSQTAPVLVFQVTARSVDQTIPPNGSFLFYACAVKSAGQAQDFDLTLNSQPLE